MHLERKLFVVSVILFLVLVGVSSIAHRGLSTSSTASKEVKTLTVGHSSIAAEVVRDEESRSRGLGGRTTLAASSGMLFVFDRTDLWGIWMKDMKLSIDVIWLDEKGRIVSVEENMSPESYPKIFFPTTRARYVLELQAGAFRASGVSKDGSIDLTRIVSGS